MAAATTDEGASTLAGDDGQEMRRGWAEVDKCAACGAELGKRKLNPRHHCRICGNSVCSTCSPSSVKLEGESRLQRACTPCVANAQLAPSLKERLTHLGGSLHAIASGHTPNSDPPTNLEEAAANCEASLGALEDQRDGYEAAKTQLQGMVIKYDNEVAHVKDAEMRAEQEEQKRHQVEAEHEDACAQREAARTRASEAEAQVVKERQARKQSEVALEDTKVRLQAVEALANAAEAEVVLGQQRLQELEHKLSNAQKEQAATAECVKDAEAHVVQEQEKLRELNVEMDDVRTLQAATAARAKDAEASVAQEQQARQQSEVAFEDAKSRLQVMEMRTMELESEAMLGQQRLQELERTLTDSRREREASEERVKDVETQLAKEQSKLNIVNVKNEDAQKQHAVTEARAKDAETRIEEQRARLEEVEKLRAVLQIINQNLEATLSQERASHEELMAKVRAVKEEGSDAAESSGEANAALRAALQVTEADAQNARRAHQHVEDSSRAGQAAILKLGERLNALAGNEGSSVTAPNGLEEAILSCEAAVPYFEQTSRRLVEAQARAERAEATLVETEAALRDLDATRRQDSSAATMPSGPLSASLTSSMDSSLANCMNEGLIRSNAPGGQHQTCVERCQLSGCTAM